MKRSNSKKSPNQASKDFSGSFCQKFSHPGGIGMYGPGKLKISKDKQNTSTRGSARWNRSPQNQHGGKITKQKAVSRMNSNKSKRHHDTSMAGIKKTAINNFMNSSKNTENSLINPVKSERLPSREKKKYKRDHSSKYQDTKSNTAKLTKEKLNNGLFNDHLVKPDGLTFKNRKLSADHGKTEKNTFKGINPSTRSRKTHSGRPSQRQSRADSRDTDSRSHKEDIKSAINNEKPANKQASSNPVKEDISKEDINILTKFAFATRVGYIPNNPYKVNQDAYILSPNI